MIVPPLSPTRCASLFRTMALRHSSLSKSDAESVAAIAPHVPEKHQRLCETIMRELLAGEQPRPMLLALADDLVQVQS